MKHINMNQSGIRAVLDTYLPSVSRCDYASNNNSEVAV